jgi:hypothetical protein
MEMHSNAQASSFACLSLKAKQSLRATPTYSSSVRDRLSAPLTSLCDSCVPKSQLATAESLCVRLLRDSKVWCVSEDPMLPELSFVSRMCMCMCACACAYVCVCLCVCVRVLVRMCAYVCVTSIVCVCNTSVVCAPSVRPLIL